ncbi:NlpC/P60 family protein [Streptomyces sp. HU2014]|uniref:C40 family peptidase n=1 Tax=Streptomyces sp. HU2014 TaxID=2939414 RepID=UPI00200E9DC0|nr:C40 family peptidase [Streptomyces sp. HU2014]UQI43553.1 NlpC/P60 family protein [Streptomyces sp. HU2014]
MRTTGSTEGVPGGRRRCAVRGLVMAAVGALVLAGFGPVGPVPAGAVPAGARPRDPGPGLDPGPAAQGQQTQQAQTGPGGGEGTAAATPAATGTGEAAGAVPVPAGTATGTPADGTGSGTGGGVTSVALEQSGSFIGPDQNAVPATPVIPGVAPETPGRDPDVVLEDPALKDPSLKLPPVAGRGTEEARQPTRPADALTPKPPDGATPKPQGPGKPAPRPPVTRGHDLEAAISFALAHIGDPYVLGGTGPRRWDCSGLIQQAYRRAGVRLPRIAADQYRATVRITRSALRRGDLVFWTNNGRISGIHHAAIYLGGGRYIEAPRPGRKVRISTFSYYNPNLYGRVR